MMQMLSRSCKSFELSCILKAQLNFDGSLDRLQRKTKPDNVRLPKNGLIARAIKKIAKKKKNRPSNEVQETDQDVPGVTMDVGESAREENSAQVDVVSENGSFGLENIPVREDVLRACTVTSLLIAALGLTIRQVSHIAVVEGLTIFDCSVEPSFSFEIWHLEVITGLVVLVSSCRYLLLKSWPEFEESSRAANQQILTSLEPLDYIVVAFLPGISEELLFRGALLPLFGFNSLSALGVGALFGILHLGSGRKYSFAIWATFVGFIYGYATIASSSIIVPMAAHGLNNLVGGLLWRFSSTGDSK